MASVTHQLLLGNAGSTIKYWIASLFQSSIFGFQSTPQAACGDSGRTHVTSAEFSTSDYGVRQHSLDMDGNVATGVSMLFVTTEDSVVGFPSETGGDTAGNQYVLNHITDMGVFLTKYNTSGTLVWSLDIVPTIGATVAPANFSRLVVTDAGDCYVGVNNWDSTYGYGSTIAKIDTSSNVIWERRLSRDVRAMSLTASGLVLLVTPLNGGDAYICMYSTSGTIGSSIQITTVAGTKALSRASFGKGNISSNIVSFVIDIADSSGATVTSHVGTLDTSTLTLSATKTHPDTSSFHYVNSAYDYTTGDVYALVRYNTGSAPADLCKFNSSMSQTWARTFTGQYNWGSFALHKDGSLLVAMMPTIFMASVFKLPNDGTKTATYTITCGTGSGSSVNIDYASSSLSFSSSSLSQSSASLTDNPGNSQYFPYGYYYGGISYTSSNQVIT